MDVRPDSTILGAPQRTACWERLEGAWKSRLPGAEPPCWSEFLPPPGEPCEPEWIFNLIQLDIEFRVKAGLPALLGVDYFGCPRLSEADARLGADQQAELIAWEYRQRWRAGDWVRRGDYEQAFPHLAGQLSRLRPRGSCPSCRGALEWPEGPTAPVRCPRCGTEVALETVFPPRAPQEGTSSRLVFPGFEVLGELGRGGMGVVYKARQITLNRPVALKVIRAGESASPTELSRLLGEAATVARLQHPNIVQIHDVARWQPPGAAGPLPCVVMEYVEGTSLDRFIDGRPQPPGAAARLVETLARAVHWMHQRGVIHRDLKPANILLAGSGQSSDRGPDDPTLPHAPCTTHQPKIADFGLAKRLDVGSGQTRSGEILGTPSYMAPEQAAGDARSAGPGADVYALGAILYDLLTGQPPFRADSSYATLELVIHASPTPPRQLQPGVPRDLETICLKCLEKEPARRYSSAGELADDLARFLNHESIHARPVGRLERAWRWCRRESKAAGLIAALFALALLAVLVVVLWLRQQQRDDQQYDEDVQKIARELDLIGNEDLALVPQMDETRRKFLEALAADCGRLLARKKHPELRRKQAEIHEHLGTIYVLLGRTREAETAYGEALAARTERGAPGDRLELARVRRKLGDLYVTVGRFTEAEDQLRAALDLLPGSETTTHTARGETLRRLGQLEALTGRLHEGEATLRQALALQTELVAEHPDAAHRLALAQTETHLAELLSEFSRLDEAARLCDAAVARQEELAGSAGAVPAYRVGLARSLRARTNLHLRAGRGKESTADRVRAYRIFKQLADDYPHRPDYRLELAGAMHSIARDNADGELNRRPTLLEERYQDAIRQHERLAAEFPDLIENRRRLAVSLNELATWLADKTAYEKAEAAKADLLRRAEEAHRQSEQIWARLCADHPSVLAYQSGLATSHLRRGIVLEQLRRYDEAEKRYREAIATQARLAAKYPEVARYQVALSGLYNNLGVIFDRRHDVTPAERYFRLSVEHGRRARALCPSDPTPGYILFVSMRNVCEMLLRREAYPKAAALVVEIPRDGNVNNFDDCSRLLEILQSCAEKAQKDAGLSSPERAARVRQYEDMALALVEKLAAKFDKEPHEPLSYLESSKAVDFLRKRVELQALQRRFAAAVKKK